MKRRELLLGATLPPGASGPQAQTFPSRPIRYIVPVACWTKRARARGIQLDA